MAAPTDIDAYLAALPREDHRRALSDLRALIRDILPDAVEGMSYAMPAHRLAAPSGRKPGKVVIGYASFARHCGVYAHSGGVVPRLAPRFPAWKASASGFLFTPDHPLPADLLRQMIELRLAEIRPHA